MLEAIVVIGGSVALTLVARWLIDRWVSKESRAEHNEICGHFFAAVGAFYAVLLAFVVVDVWESLGSAKQNTYDEANALPGLYYSATAFPEQQAELQEIVVSYTHNVITDEWPMLATGQPSPKVEDAARRMRRTLLQLEPEGGKQENLHSSMIDRINTVNSARRARLNEAHPSINGIFWGGLVVGAALVLGTALFFGAPRTLPVALMVTALALIVSSSLYLAYLMDHPFRGVISISPDAFRLALTQMGQVPP
jgi:hypothetical protein